jgi:methyl-accepting chemotaxis protein/tetratricopeptide (TPR) repeat protein
MTASSKSSPNLPTPQHIAALAAEVEREPKDLVNKITLANVLEQRGDVVKAAALYQEAIAQDSDGVYGSVARKALEALENSEAWRETTSQETGKPTARSNPATTEALVAQRSGRENTPRAHPLAGKMRAAGSRITRTWQHLNFRTKLAIVLVASTALPVIVVTHEIVNITRNALLQKFQQSLQRDGMYFSEDYVMWSVDEAQTEAETIAQFVQTLKINLSDQSQVGAYQQQLQGYIEGLKVSDASDSAEKNLRIVTDAQGKTIAQYIQTLSETSFNPSAEQLQLSPQYRRVSLPLGIELADIPIVQNALRTGKTLRGMELWNDNFLKRLGQDQQANIGVRMQLHAEQPAPASTYDIDEGKAALVSIVVQPIKLNDRVVGMVIVGAVENRNFLNTDSLKKRVGIPISAIFAQDWLIASNIPSKDSKTRDIGTRSPQAVAAAVLGRGQEFIGQTTIAGKEYLGAYQPLYDHQQELNPTQAKPVGMTFVARPMSELDGLLAQQQKIAYGIGTGMLLIVALMAIPIANSFARPLKRLADFAQVVGTGKQGERLEDKGRGDEIGILVRQLNLMSANIEANLEALRASESRQRQEKERLQRGMINLLLETETVKQGDLTVKAKVTQGETGAIADAFNTVIASLREIVLQVKTAAEQVQVSAVDSEASVEKLAYDATTQAEAVAEALTSVEEMEQSIFAIANSAQTAATIASQALESARDSDQTMDETVASMETLRSNAAETTLKAKRLAESSQEISKIVSIISGISEKTNVLAFNAAIEATRAGENGKGFRLVANEVRRLAEKVTDATKEIERLVQAIQQGTSDVLKTMEVSNASVETGTQLVAKTKQNLQNMAEISQEIDQLLQSISVRTVSQADNSCMVNQTMQTVAAIARTNSTESAAVLSALQELLEVASELQLSVSRFRVED